MQGPIKIRNIQYSRPNRIREYYYILSSALNSEYSEIREMYMKLQNGSNIFWISMLQSAPVRNQSRRTVLVLFITLQIDFRCYLWGKFFSLIPLLPYHSPPDWITSLDALHGFHIIMHSLLDPGDSPTIRIMHFASVVLG